MFLINLIVQNRSRILCNNCKYFLYPLNSKRKYSLRVYLYFNIFPGPSFSGPRITSCSVLLLGIPESLLNRHYLNYCLSKKIQIDFEPFDSNGTEISDFCLGCVWGGVECCFVFCDLQVFVGLAGTDILCALFQF